MTLDAGEEFQDPGATAIDDIDGDLTNTIEVEGAVSSTIIGSYTITYTAVDRSGNLIQATRVVNVQAQTGGGGGGGSTGLLIVICLMTLATARRRSTWRLRDAVTRT
jgi:hypothetical protein